MESLLHRRCNLNIGMQTLMHSGKHAGECELIDHNFKDGRVSPFSLPRCRNVYVLPGVPDLLQQKWRTLKVRSALPLSCGLSGPHGCCKHKAHTTEGQAPGTTGSCLASQLSAAAIIKTVDGQWTRHRQHRQSHARCEL